LTVSPVEVRPAGPPRVCVSSRFSRRPGRPRSIAPRKPLPILSELHDAGVEAILWRLRQDVRARPPMPVTTDDGKGAVPVVLTARREANRFAAVSADRPYYYRPGRLGRTRGLLLLPMKAVLKKLMRWYVEPVAHDQRQFNGATMR